MLKPGIYKHVHFHEYVEDTVYEGEISVCVKETPKQFRLEFIRSTVRYNAPQIDDMFRWSKNVVISKNGSDHAIQVWDDVSFTLYPYRVGVPYLFSLEAETEGSEKGEPKVSVKRLAR